MTTYTYVPGVYNDRSRRCIRLAGSYADSLRLTGLLGVDGAQLLFDRLSDLFLTFTEEELDCLYRDLEMAYSVYTDPTDPSEPSEK